MNIVCFTIMFYSVGRTFYRSNLTSVTSAPWNPSQLQIRSTPTRDGHTNKHKHFTCICYINTVL